jgi:hypothetical protein
VTLVSEASPAQSDYRIQAKTALPTDTQNLSEVPVVLMCYLFAFEPGLEKETQEMDGIGLFSSAKPKGRYVKSTGHQWDDTGRVVSVKHFSPHPLSKTRVDGEFFVSGTLIWAIIAGDTDWSNSD